MKPAISFIIPATELSSRLKLVLQCIFNQELPENYQYEILLVLNGHQFTRDEIDVFIKDERVKFIQSKEYGRSLARNLGVSHTTGEFLVFVDSDTLLAPSWARIIMEQMTGYAAAQGRVIPVGKNSFLNNYRLWRSHKHSNGSFLNCWNQQSIVPGINTAACIYRREFFEKAGGFSEELNRHEDYDLSRKVFHLGGGLLYLSDVEAQVFYDESIWTYLKRAFEVGFWAKASHDLWDDKMVDDRLNKFSIGSPEEIFYSINQRLELLGYKWRSLFYKRLGPRSYIRTKLAMRVSPPEVKFLTIDGVSFCTYSSDSFRLFPARV